MAWCRCRDGKAKKKRLLNANSFPPLVSVSFLLKMTTFACYVRDGCLFINLKLSLSKLYINFCVLSPGFDRWNRSVPLRETFNMLEGNRVAVWAALVILAISSTVRSQENELFQCPDGKPRFFSLFFKKNTGSYHCMVQRCSTYILSCVRYQVISLLLRFFRKEFAATPTSNQWQQLHKNRKKQLGWTCNDEKKVERGAGNICATTTTTKRKKEKACNPTLLAFAVL